MVLGTCLWRVFFMYNWLKKVLLISLPGINSGDNANHMEPIDDSMYARYISYRWFYSIRLPFLVEGDAILIFGGWVNLSHCSNPEVDAFTSHGTRKRDYLLVLLCLFFLYPSVSCSQMTKWMALHYTAVTASFCSSLTLVDQSYLLQLAPFSLPFFFFFFSNTVSFIQGQCDMKRLLVRYISAPGMKTFRIAILCMDRKQVKTLRLFFISVK